MDHGGRTMPPPAPPPAPPPCPTPCLSLHSVHQHPTILASQSWSVVEAPLSVPNITNQKDTWEYCSEPTCVFDMCGVVYCLWWRTCVLCVVTWFWLCCYLFDWGNMFGDEYDCNWLWLVHHSVCIWANLYKLKRVKSLLEPAKWSVVVIGDVLCMTNCYTPVHCTITPRQSTRTLSVRHKVMNEIT